MEPKIIFEDEHILVVDKPSGMVVNRSETAVGETVQDWMEKKSKIKNQKSKVDNEFAKRSGVVHRLDKDTSGAMVLAKNPEVFQNLKSQFKNRKVKKEYIALVHGKVSPKKGNINLPVARNPKNRMRFTVKVGGRKALTFYEAENYFYDKKDNPLYDKRFSLMRVRPKTGRTHQIRVHFSFLGHPIASDPLYLSKKKLESDLKWCPRLFLHAERLVFKHPKTKKRMEFVVELAEDLQEVIRLR